MSWIIKQLLGMLDKQELLKLAWRILRKAFGHVYETAVILVKRAEANEQLESGLDRALWVARELVKQYNELKEWQWLINIIIEAAVAEVKNYDLLPTRIKL